MKDFIVKYQVNFFLIISAIVFYAIFVNRSFVIGIDNEIITRYASYALHGTLMDGDDIGYVAFGQLAFKLFGPELQSVYWLFLGFLSISFALFLIEFRSNVAALLTATLIMLGYYAVVSIFPLTPELGGPHNPRAIAFMTMFALCHVVFMTIERKNIKKIGFLFVLMQSLLITLAIYMRMAQLWQIIVLLGIAGLLGFLIIFIRSKRESTNVFKKFLTLWPVAMVFIELFVGMTLRPVLHANQPQPRIFWHNVGMGLSLDEGISETYGLSVNDFHMYRAVIDYLLINESFDDLTRISNSEKFSSKDEIIAFYSNHQNYMNEWISYMDWDYYDKIAKGFIVYILQRDPIGVVNAFTFGRLKMGFANLKYAVGLPIDDLAAAGLKDQEFILASDQEREHDGLYLSVITGPSMVFFGVLVLLASRFNWVDRGILSRRSVSTSLYVVAAIAAGSAIPIILTYPVLHVLSEFLMLSVALLYAICAVFFIRVNLFLRKKLYHDVLGVFLVGIGAIAFFHPI